MHKKFVLSEGAKKLLKKCEEKKIDTSVMGPCKLLLEEMDRGEVDLGEKDPDESYLQMAQEIEHIDVPKILMMAFKIKDRPNIEPELKVAADRLIRAVEAL
ncbi:MAG: hypothetical protein ACXVHW_07095 [Methanobacterium sp.]